MLPENRQQPLYPLDRLLFRQHTALTAFERSPTDGTDTVFGQCLALAAADAGLAPLQLAAAAAYAAGMGGAAAAAAGTNGGILSYHIASPYHSSGGFR